MISYCRLFKFFCRIAFIDVEVQDCEKVLCLHAQEWDGCELQVKMDDTPSRKKRKNSMHIFYFSFHLLNID